MLQSRQIHFLEHAQMCRDRARAVPGMKHLYLEMAQDWELLASLARELVRDAAERDAFFGKAQLI